MKSKNKKIIFFSLIIILIIIAYFVFFTSDKSTIEVKTMNSYKGNIEKTLEISGTIESSDSEIISIQPNLEVVKIYYNEYDYVEKGDLIVELETDSLKISLDKAKLNLEQLQNDLEDLNNPSSNSEKLILINAIEKSKTSLNSIESNLKDAQEDLKTTKILLENNAISQNEYDSQVDLVDDLKTNIKNAQIAYEDSVLRLSNFNENKSQSSDKLKLQIESVELDISSIKKSIADRSIYSNLNGIITEFNFKEGRLTNNSSIISILNDSSYEFISLVPQEDAVLIEKNQDANISLDGLNKQYKGRVSSVGKTAEVDPNSGSQTPKIEIKIIISNGDGKISSGYNGDGILTLDKKEDVLLIRNEAVKTDNNGSYLFKVLENTVEKIYIESSITDGYFSSIDSGIKENDEVVLNPPMELQDGSIITIVD